MFMKWGILHFKSFLPLSFCDVYLYIYRCTRVTNKARRRRIDTNSRSAEGRSGLDIRDHSVSGFVGLDSVERRNSETNSRPIPRIWSVSFFFSFTSEHIFALSMVTAVRVHLVRVMFGYVEKHPSSYVG